MYGCEVGESERKYITVCAGMKCEGVMYEVGESECKAMTACMGKK